MKIKLLSALVFTVLSIIGFSATADEIVDTSSCAKVIISKAVDNKYVELEALRCPHLSSGYVIQFYTIAYHCLFVPVDPTTYRVTGTCKDYVLYRRQ